MDRGERGCPGPPKPFEENLRTCFLYLYLWYPVFSVLLLHYAYVSLLRAFAYPAIGRGR